MPQARQTPAGKRASRGSTPPPMRSNLDSRKGSSPRTLKNDWFSPLKPISTFKGKPPISTRASPTSPGKTSTLDRHSTSPSGLGRTDAGGRSRSPGFAAGLISALPRAVAPDDSDEEPQGIIESSDDDGTGTAEQQQAKKQRRERRRTHRAFLTQMRAEKKKIHERVTAAIFQCHDVMNDDHAALKEEALELRERVSELVGQYQEQNNKGVQDLVDIRSWFNRVETLDKSSNEAKPSCDVGEFDHGVEQVNEIVNSMTSSRESVEYKAHMLIDTAIEMINNDDSKKLLHEQQMRFVDEVNSLVKSLERVESHAKGLTQNNIDLRLQLKQVQDEMHQWKFKFLKIENTKDSMTRQMEAAIIQRTEALKSTMTGDYGNQVASMMDQVTMMQEKAFELTETIAKLRSEVLEEQFKTRKGEETIKQMGIDMIDLRQAAGPTADLIAKLRGDVDIAKRGEMQLRKDLHQARNQIKRLSGEQVPEGTDDEIPVGVDRAVQCVLLGIVYDNNTGDDGPTSSADPRKLSSNTFDDERGNANIKVSSKTVLSDEDLEAEMEDKEKLKAMARRIELLKKQSDSLGKEAAELKRVTMGKEKLISDQKATIDEQQATIQKMLNTNEGQRIMLDEVINDGNSRQRLALPNIAHDDRSGRERGTGFNGGNSSGDFPGDGTSQKKSGAVRKAEKNAENVNTSGKVKKGGMPADADGVGVQGEGDGSKTVPQSGASGTKKGKGKGKAGSGGSSTGLWGDDKSTNGGVEPGSSTGGYTGGTRSSEGRNEKAASGTEAAGSARAACEDFEQVSMCR